MKQVLFFFILCSITLQSQNFNKVDNLVSQYPKFTKIEDLTNQIEKDFTSDENKARAAFYWLAKNIRYNLKEYYNPKQRSYQFKYSSEEEKISKLQAIKDKLVSTTFKTKTGVCEEYAQSFKKICDLLGLEAAVISGYVRNSPKEIGRPKKYSNHAWNAVKLNNKWLILDATWAAGHLINGKWIRKFNNYFYNMPKDKIFKTHYPEDSLWVLRFGSISKEEFYNQPIYDASLLSSKAELLTSTTGILKVNASKEIILKFKNLENSSLIRYAFRGDRYSTKPTISFAENTYTLTIKNAKQNSFLTLYLDQSAILQFQTN
ncbi:transglutaminase domain-containing protein [uncultured Polaribacter sp.]|uniref:transglutaminase domain-containing protein n=1 Tax=uncultured Polaribacter sp. TaxID=174711 RepID=UPI00262196B6|nr:transglutaminase domain-containing protein [uncultured Polaribacter sp.]